MRVWVEAYGCTMNQGEGRDLRATLLAEGHEPAPAPEGADAVVLVTCNVIGATERRMVRRIRELGGGPQELVVAGCMAASRRGLVQSIAPEAHLLRPRELHRIREVLPGPSGSCPVPPDAMFLAEDGRVDAIVPIGQGCLNACTYCVTRVARGRISSYPLEDLVARVEAEVGRGAKEILLTGQDTAAYGRDRGDTLAGLVEAVAQVRGDFRIRVGMASPYTVRPILDDLLRAYRHPKVYTFLHLPVQSGSDAILETMRREYAVEDFLEIVEAYRGAFPRGTLSTDFIVGFPGETDADHRESLDLLRRVEPEIVNVTRFSPREGTPAYGLPNHVVGWRAKERSREMTRLKEAIGRARNRQWVGRRVTARTTERGKPGTTVARTREYRPLVLKGTFPLGIEVSAVVSAATAAYLIGTPQADAPTTAQSTAAAPA